MFKSFLKRQLLARDFWFQRKTGVLIENWRSELKFDISFLIAHLLQRRDPLTFVQIGAYDGVANDALADFIRRGKLRGVLVEPQPDAFARLQENHRGQAGLIFENSAVGAAAGEATFYRVKAEFESLVVRSRQMSGFSPDVLLKHYRSALASPETAIETITVPTITFPQLLAKHGLTTLDLLQIDAEGHDLEVLQGLDFGRLRPAIIGFETAHLSRAELTCSYELLLKHGYLLYEAAPDCVAYQRSVREAAPGF